MSTECIELESSDDEVQLVEVSKTQKAKKQSEVVSIYRVYPVDEAAPAASINAIQKLKRNFNIDVSINIDGDDSNRTTHKPINGTSSKSFKNILPKENMPVRNGFNSISSDVVVIDDQDDELSKSNASTSFKRTESASLPKSSNQSEHQSAAHRRISPLNPLDTKSLRTPSVTADTKITISTTKIIHPQPVTNSTPNSVDILNDVVYIIDDDEVENTPKSHTIPQKLIGVKPNRVISEQNKELSHTEALVNSFREKIKTKLQRESFTNITNRPTNKTEDTEETPITRGTTGRKRFNPDLSVVDDANIVNSKFRVTRSSLFQEQQSSSTSGSGSNTTDEPMKQYAIENMFSGLVSACIKTFTDNAPTEEKLWDYFKRTSDQVLRSTDFIEALKEALKTMDEITSNSLDDKLIAMRKVKEVIRIMKRQPEVVNRKVKKLTKVLNIICSRIKMIEEKEVTSDEDEENTYITLDRYRTKATKIYEKICELQEQAADAGRVVRQRFHFTGSGRYPKLEQALEKFYNKTRRFPDFFDVKMLVEATVKKENLDIAPHNIHNTAQCLFLEFGNKLKRMRSYDDYMVMNDYLEEGKTKDPALDNEELYTELQKLDSTKKFREAEERIMEEFVNRQAEIKIKTETTKGQDSDNTTSDVDEGNDSAIDNKVETKNLNFSDTDDELINEKMQRKRKRNSSEEESGEETEANKMKCTEEPLNVAGLSYFKGTINDLSDNFSQGAIDPL